MSVSRIAEPESTTPPSVVVALCNTLSRIGVDQVLSAHGSAIAHADPVAAEVVRAVRAHQPQVAVICVDECRAPPPMSELWEANGTLGLVMLGQAGETESPLATALEALRDAPGGFCYLPTSAIKSPHQLSAAVQQVAEGSVIIDSSLASLLTSDEPSHVAETQLSAREREILGLVACGYRNAVIAARLVITERAIEKHLNAIYRKLGLNHSGHQHPRVMATRYFLDNYGPPTGSPTALKAWRSARGNRRATPGPI